MITEKTVSESKFNKGYLQSICQIGAVALFIVFGLSACSKRYSDMPAFSGIPLRNYENHSVGRFKSSYLAGQIDEYYNGLNPGPIGVTTFVNLDDLYATSSFGRVYAEQVMSELSMRGYEVVELRHSDALQFLNSTGEFALSREIASVRRERDLGGLIVGTYVVSPVRVYVNARLIDPATSVVVSAGSVEMTKTKEIAKLVKGGAFSPSLERIPVRHLGNRQYPLYGGFQRNRAYDWEESQYPEPSYWPGEDMPGGDAKGAPRAPEKNKR